MSPFASAAVDGTTTLRPGTPMNSEVSDPDAVVSVGGDELVVLGGGHVLAEVEDARVAPHFLMNAGIDGGNEGKLCHVCRSGSGVDVVECGLGLGEGTLDGEIDRRVHF